MVFTFAYANPQPSLIDSKDCNQMLSNYDILIDHGKIHSDGESTIVEINDNKLSMIRIGSILEEEILDAI